MRRLLIAPLWCALVLPMALPAQQKPPTPPRSSSDSARSAKTPKAPPRDTLTREQRQLVRETVRDARSMTRRRMGGDSATRAALTNEAAGTAFGSAEARAVVDKARESRERQDSALKAYRATTTQRISMGMGARRLGLEKLLFRGDNVAEISWRRDVGIRVRPIGSRMTVPMASEVSGDFVSAVTVPYFPGREQLWFPSSDFGMVKTEVDDRDMIHPLARGAERFYRYETGDSANITLPDGRVIHLRELHITARKPDWRTFVGSFWFDRDGGQLVRAAYRMATDIDIWGIAGDEAEKDAAENKQLAPVRDSLLRARLPRELYVKDSTERARLEKWQGQNPDDKPPAWVTATMRPMKASLDAITVEYALFKGKFWLPRAHSATASADVMFMRMPFRFDEKFTYEDVDGDFTLAPLPSSRNRNASADSAKSDSTSVDLNNSGVQVAVSAGPGSKKPAAKSDSVEARRYGRSKVRQCAKDSTWTRVEERYDRQVKIAYDLPCDMERLRNSPALPAETASDEELFDIKGQQQLLEALGMSLQTPWSPQLPKLRVGSDLLRYNRIEGLSVGAELSQVLGAGYALKGVGRIGHADRHANGELSLARTNGLRTVTGTVYHRLAATNPEWAGALSLGPSLPALLYGRDEGFYYRTMGVSLGEQREQRHGTLEYGLFLERQWTAGDTGVVNTFSLARAFSDRRFNANIPAELATFTGATLAWSRVWLDQPKAWRVTSVTRAEAATGTFEYARGSLEQTVSRPIGRINAAITGAVGSSAGRLPVQRAWYVGGLRTVRGQVPGTQSGDAFWYGRAEVGTKQGFVRPVLFYDLGWAGSRKAFGNGQTQRGAGFGLGFLDGLFRIDVARGIVPFKRWRTDFYIGAPL